MTKNHKPNYRPVMHTTEYESPQVLKVVELPGPNDQRQFSEQCVIDVPEAGPQELKSTDAGTPQSPYGAYLPVVISNTCTCNAVCSCDVVGVPTPTATATTVPNQCVVDTIEGGSGGSTVNQSDTDIGNLFLVSTRVLLQDVATYLRNITETLSLYYFVYEGVAESGDYSLIQQSFINDSGTGDRWYSSGPMNVVLEAGKYYFIGISWKGSTLLAQDFISLPLPVSFGSVEGKSSSHFPKAGYPPAATISVKSYGWSSYHPYFMKLSVCSLVSPPATPTGTWIPTSTPTDTATPTPTSTATRRPCSCQGDCTCNPQTYYHCTCNPQTYYHCTCNPQTYYYCTCNPQTYWK